MTTTKTKVATKTKVITGLAIAGAIILAGGYGFVWKVTVKDVPVLRGDTSTGAVNFGPDLSNIFKKVSETPSGGDPVTDPVTDPDSDPNSDPQPDPQPDPTSDPASGTE